MAKISKALQKVSTEKGQPQRKLSLQSERAQAPSYGNFDEIKSVLTEMQ